MLFIFSIIFLRTRKYEEQEAEYKNIESKRTSDVIENIESMRIYQIQKAVQLIKDYKFKSSICIQLELMLLAFVSSFSATVMVLPYTLIFIFLGLIMAWSENQNLLRKVSNKFNLVLISLLLIDLPGKYFMKGSRVLEEDTDQRFYIQVIGLLSSLATYIEFYIKILLFLVECQKLQYSYDYDVLYEQIKAHHAERPEMQRFFRKRISFKNRIFKPISLFMFCSLAIIYALLHPSVLFFFMMPLFIYGFFMTPSSFKNLAKLFILIFALYIISAFLFNLAELIIPDSQKKEKYSSYVEKFLGLKRDSALFTEIFPYQFDFFFYIIMAFFVKFINKKTQTTQDQERSYNYLRAGIDEDILTIPDDVSDIRGKGSLPSLPRGSAGTYERNIFQKQRNFEVPYTIAEELKEHEDGEEHSKSVHSNFKRKPYINRDSSFNQRHMLQNMQRDETLRGKIRRWFLKVYLKVKFIFDKIVDLTIIHSSKLALFALFCVSVSYPNLINCILFILFLAFSLAKYHTIQKYWKIPITYNAIVIIALYGYDVFAPKGIEGLDPKTLDLIGITKQQDQNFKKYYSYLILMVILIISYYVLNSQRYKEFLLEYSNLQQRDSVKQDADQEPINGQSPNESIGLSDPMTKFVIKNSIYLLTFAIFIECSLLPVSIINFVLLTLMTVIVIKYFCNDTQLELYLRLKTTLKTLRVFSVIFIFLKYMFQFKDYAYDIVKISNAEARQIYQELPLLEKLLGIENSYVPLKLFSLALVLVLSNLQLKFLNQSYLKEIIMEDNNQWNRLTFKDKKIKSNFFVFAHHMKIYTLFFLYHLLIPLPVIIVVLYAFVYMSILGFTLFTCALLVLYAQKRSFWQFSYQIIGIISSIALMIVYSLQFLFINKSINFEIINWIGVQKEDEQNNVIYDQLIPIFIILVSCAFQKMSIKCETLFVETVKFEDLEKEDVVEENENALFHQIYNKKEERSAIYEYEAPIRHCIDFRDNYLRQQFFLNGLNLQIFIALVTMLWKLNITSLFYMWYFVVLFKKNYFPKKFVETNEQQAKREKVAYLLSHQVIFITFVMIFEYVMSLKPTSLIDLQSWKKQISSKLCLLKDEECMQDWEQWLSLQSFPKEYMVIDFVFLMVSYLNYFFTSGVVKLQDQHFMQSPKINDEYDFFSSQKYNKYINTYFQLIFNGFPYILIVSTMIFASSFHGYGMSDLISMVYLCFSFFYVVNFRKLFTQNLKILRYMRNYNFVVLFLILTFQTPIFLCPAVSNDVSDHYLTKPECAAIYENQTNGTKNYGNESLMAFYIVLTQSLGLYKIDNILYQLIYIIIITEIQCQIFDHPYFNVYVLEHMKLEKQTDGRLRAFMYVEKNHLNTLWSYKAIKEEIRILHDRLVRIMQTIRNSEISRHLLDEEDEDRQKLIQEEDKSQASSEYLSGDEEPSSALVDSPQQNLQNKMLDQIVEKHRAEIENLALSMLSRPETPVISLKLFTAAFKNYLQSSKNFQIELYNEGSESSIEEQLQLIVLKLQKQVHLKNRMDLYNKEGIGLNFAIQKGSTDYLQEGDFAFYSHLILDKQRNSASEANLLMSLESQKEFEVKENYEEFVQIYDQYKEVSKQKTSLLDKLDFYVRSYLWTKFINKQLFYSLTQGNKSQITLDKIHFISLIGNSILSQSQNICYLMLFINFILNANILSLVLPLSALFYGLLDSPQANVKYWKALMIYLLGVIGLKFLYQLPIFCGTPPYSLFSVEGCSNQEIMPEVLISRIDYIIGIHKFHGPSAFYKGQGILMGIIGDLIVLISLLLHKNYLIKVGLWHYVRTKNEIQQNPSFKCNPSELSESERVNLIRQENLMIYDYDTRNIFGKSMYQVSEFFAYLKNFTYKLMPNFLPLKQRNLDLRTQKDMPFTVINYKRVKPGKDYFSQNFFTLLLILVFNLFFYKSISGEDQTAIPSVNLQRFSVPQVGVLFCLLALMMVERMIYRTRQVNSSNSSAQQGLLSKHALTIKIILHFAMVIIVHIQLGFVVPMNNAVTMSRKFALIFAYLLWIMYFAFSALQIRYGYPQAPFKPPFTRDTSFFKVLGFRIYKAVPFLWEMKVIIDWTVTATCLDLFQWFKLDDAFNYLYYNQYQNNDRRQRPEFLQRSWYEKFFQGFCFAFGLILVILAPILLFSGINPIMVKNPVISASLQISLEMNSNGNSYEILSTQGFNIQTLSKYDIDGLRRLFTPVNVQYDDEDMQKMYFSPYSETQWSISPPSLQKFIDDFNSFKGQDRAFVDIKSSWQFKRDNPIGNEVTSSQSNIKLDINDFQPIVDLLVNQDKNATNNTDRTISTIFVRDMFPKMLRLGSSSQARQLEVLPLQNISSFSSAQLMLNKLESGDLYWTFSIAPSDIQGLFSEKQTDKSKSDNMIVVVYNEEVIGSLFGSALQLSVVGLYATIVIAIGRFIRLIFDRISQRMIYEEMPDTEKLFEICEGIFIAQLEGDLVKEKRLYDLLIRMYRSPETLIKLTGTKIDYRKKKNQRKNSSLWLGESSLQDKQDFKK